MGSLVWQIKAGTAVQVQNNPRIWRIPPHVSPDTDHQLQRRYGLMRRFFTIGASSSVKCQNEIMVPGPARNGGQIPCLHVLKNLRCEDHLSKPASQT